MMAMNIEEQIYFAVIFTSFTILLLTIVIILVVAAGNRRRLKQQAEMVQMRLTLEQQHSTAIIQMQEEERIRIGQNLHDDLGSRLSINKLMLEDLLLNLDNRQNAEIKESLNQISQINIQSIDDLRQISRELSSSRIQTIGLVKALSGKVNEFNKAGAVIFTLITDQNTPSLPVLHEITLYRIINELLNNVLKHSDATEAKIQMNTIADNLIILVEDNGKGINLNKQTSDGIGLNNIQHRINYLKGRFRIEPILPSGTLDDLIIPLQS